MVECLQVRYTNGATFVKVDLRGTIAPDWAGMNTALPPFAERQHYGIQGYGAHQWLKKGSCLGGCSHFHGENARFERLDIFRVDCIAQLHAIFEFIRSEKGYVPSSAQLEATCRIHLLLLSLSFPSYSCVSDGLQPRAAELMRYMAELEVRCRVGRGRGTRDSRSSLDGP